MGSIYRRKYKDKKTGKMKESTVWWISYYRNGVKMRESSESDKISVAKETLKKREGAIADGVPISPRMTKVKFKEPGHGRCQRLQDERPGHHGGNRQKNSLAHPAAVRGTTSQCYFDR